MCDVTQHGHFPTNSAGAHTLVSTNLDWGRRIVKGILAYANKVGPWHILVYPQISANVDELPKGWKANGIIGRITSPELAKEIKNSGD